MPAIKILNVKQKIVKRNVAFEDENQVDGVDIVDDDADVVVRRAKDSKQIKTHQTLPRGELKELGQTANEI